MSNRNNSEQYKPEDHVSAGNDMSDGDARDEERMDKDEDLKTGHDNGSPLAKPFENEQRITPSSLSAPDANNGHGDSAKAEDEEPDPTSDDMPELKVEYPDEK